MRGSSYAADRLGKNISGNLPNRDRDIGVDCEHMTLSLCFVGVAQAVVPRGAPQRAPRAGRAHVGGR